jgi:hypothetical protein
LGCTDLVLPSDPDVFVEPDGRASCLEVRPAVLDFRAALTALPMTQTVHLIDACGVPHDFRFEMDDHEAVFQATDTMSLAGFDPLVLPITFDPRSPAPGATFDAQLLIFEEDARLASVQLGAVVEGE